jgi:zinc and cadmium transporter
MLMLFFIERVIHWHHAHGSHEKDHTFDEAGSKKHVGYKVAVADGVHNFIDGIIIGVAFLAGPEIGLATTLAVALHEIPQEISDTILLLHAGFSRSNAIFINFLSAFSSIAGVAVVALFGSLFESLIPFAVALTAGGFIYIALEDLVPEIAKQKDTKIVFLLLGISALGAFCMAVFIGNAP